MSTISKWLNELGLAQYTIVFVENAIDFEVLPDLTEQDLKELNIPLGHRKKLLRAIGAIQGPTAPARDEAERRQLTVMFCDMVGSTALSTQLDPEDLRDVIKRFQHCCEAVIRQFGGNVARYMGDGMLVYFGYPQADEHDAERAVRAGLGIVEAVGELKPRPGVTLQTRVGVATGLVVVGDLIGKGAAQEQAVVGETPNLAARLQALAEPNTVVISDETNRLAGGLFEYSDLGEHTLKGFTDTVQAWRVVGESAAASRFEAARGARKNTPLVGRERELAALSDLWEKARTGMGQAVLIAGEAGIGKSRLTEALRERVADEPHTVLRYFCSPYGQNSAWSPVIAQLERAAGLSRTDTADEKLDKLESLVGQAMDDVKKVAPLFARLLSISADHRYPPLELSPEAQKEATLAAVEAQLAGLAQRRPVLVIVEDVHWTDPTTLVLQERLIDRSRALNVLCVITCRPEFESSWDNQPHLSTLTLERLDRDHGSAMVSKLTGKKLPVDVLEQIITKTDGVPLFVEELTKTILETGVLTERSDRYELDQPLPALAIPSTLQDSLMARLDRLTTVKPLTQLAAVIGRVFSYELIHAVTALDEIKLQKDLNTLVEAELIIQSGAPPDASYLFKHALIQDAAYQSLLKSTLRTHHRRIAEVLEERFPDSTETQPELLARHYAEAGVFEKAVPFEQRAGERAMMRSAYVEAINHRETALTLLRNLPESRERSTLELNVQVTLAPVLVATRGYGAPEVEGSYNRAYELCHALDDSTLLPPVLWYQSYIHMSLGKMTNARKLSEQMLELAERKRDTGIRLEAEDELGQICFFAGQFAAARVHLQRALDIYQPEQHHELAYIYGQEDPAVTCLGFDAWSLSCLGYADQALERVDKALRHARKLSHPHSMAWALFSAAIVHNFRRDEHATQAGADACIAFATRQGFPHWVAVSQVVRGGALAVRGQADKAISEIDEALTVWDATVGGLAMPMLLGISSAVRGAAGDPEQGLAVLDEAFRILDTSEERWYESELHRLKGQLSLASHRPSAVAAECFRTAIDIARGQQAKLLELRAATSLARLLLDRGERDEARESLAGIYGWFDEGFDTRDLQEAEGLLLFIGH